MLIAAIESRFFVQEFNDNTFSMLTGLPLQKKRSKTLHNPLSITNASFPTNPGNSETTASPPLNEIPEFEKSDDPSPPTSPGTGDSASTPLQKENPAPADKYVKRVLESHGSRKSKTWINSKPLDAHLM